MKLGAGNEIVYDKTTNTFRVFGPQINEIKKCLQNIVRVEEIHAPELPKTPRKIEKRVAKIDPNVEHMKNISREYLEKIGMEITPDNLRLAAEALCHLNRTNSPCECDTHWRFVLTRRSKNMAENTPCTVSSAVRCKCSNL